MHGNKEGITRSNERTKVVPWVLYAMQQTVGFVYLYKRNTVAKSNFNWC